jgi:hypothetical protein
MQEHPLKTMEKIDPTLMKLVEKSRHLAFGGGFNAVDPDTVFVTHSRHFVQHDLIQTIAEVLE